MITMAAAEVMIKNIKVKIQEMCIQLSTYGEEYLFMTFNLRNKEKWLLGTPKGIDYIKLNMQFYENFQKYCCEKMDNPIPSGEVVIKNDVITKGKEGEHGPVTEKVVNVTKTLSTMKEKTGQPSFKVKIDRSVKNFTNTGRSDKSFTTGRRHNQSKPKQVKESSFEGFTETVNSPEVEDKVIFSDSENENDATVEPEDDKEDWNLLSDTGDDEQNRSQGQSVRSVSIKINHNAKISMVKSSYIDKDETPNSNNSNKEIKSSNSKGDDLLTDSKRMGLTAKNIASKEVGAKGENKVHVSLSGDKKAIVSKEPLIKRDTFNINSDGILVLQFNCSLCNKTFDQRQHLNKHMAQEHDRSWKFQCHICKRKFQLEKSYKNHIIMHKIVGNPKSANKPAKSLDKDLEENLFSNVSVYTKSDADASDKPADNDVEVLAPDNVLGVQCSFCKQILPNIGKLKNHIKEVHVKDKKFKCAICHKAFYNKKNLNSHVLIHLNKQRICDICGEVLTSFREMLAHKRIKHPWRCTICHKKFQRRLNVKFHMERFHSGDNVGCDCYICDKKFNDKSKLLEHLLLHSGGKEYYLKVSVEEQKKDASCQIIEKSKSLLVDPEKDALGELNDSCSESNEIPKHKVSTRTEKVKNSKIPAASRTLPARKVKCKQIIKQSKSLLKPLLENPEEHVFEESNDSFSESKDRPKQKVTTKTKDVESTIITATSKTLPARKGKSKFQDKPTETNILAKVGKAKSLKARYADTSMARSVPDKVKDGYPPDDKQLHSVLYTDHSYISGTKHFPKSKDPVPDNELAAEEMINYTVRTSCLKLMKKKPLSRKSNDTQAPENAALVKGAKGTDSEVKGQRHKQSESDSVEIVEKRIGQGKGHNKSYRCEQCKRAFYFKKPYERHLLMHSLISSSQDNNDSIATVEPSSFGIDGTDAIVTMETAAEMTATDGTAAMDTSTNAPGETKMEAKALYESGNLLGVQCNICKKIYPSLLKVKEHIKYVHYGERNFECDICHKKCKSVKNLRGHRKIHFSDKRICAICGEEHISFREMLRHMRLNHPNSFQCHMCGDVFKKNALLKYHIQQHNGELVKPHQCTICGKKFGGKMKLTEHIRIHTKEKPFTCEICGKSFARIGDITTHKKLSHTDQKSVCPYCNKELYSLQILKNHVLTVHPGYIDDFLTSKGLTFKYYTCEYCGRFLPDKPRYDAHVNTHTGQKPYDCQICSKSFGSKLALRIHKKSHSSDEQNLFGSGDGTQSHAYSAHHSDDSSPDFMALLM